jgi:hypothetical protein
MSVLLTKSDEKSSSRGLQTVTAQAVITNYFQESSHEPRRTTMDENDDICRNKPILIREICVNLCPIFEGVNTS